MNGNIRVGQIFGIPFYINPSWFLILVLVTLSYGSDLARFPGLSGPLAFILGFVVALLLFASVVAHELGHSFAALSQGIEVKSITLFLFGGLASLEKESATPFESFMVAIAGPLVSLLLFALFFIMGTQLTFSAPLTAILSLLAYINLALGLFNLIPGLPLDGGNILKALVWQLTGNPNKGIIFASRVGQLLGWIGIIIGGLAVLGISTVGNLWTMLIGFFLLQNAKFSAQSAQIQEILNQYKISDVISPDSPVVDSELTLRDFANNYVIGQNKWKRFLVIDESRKLVGAIDVEDLKKVSTSLWTETHVRELTHSVDALTTIDPGQSLLTALQVMESQKTPQLAVVSGDGVVLGLIERDSIRNLL